jgi:hypothetical protein
VRRVASSGQTLAAIDLGGPAAAWERLGFRLSGGAIGLGSTLLRPGGAGGGIRGWTIAGLASENLDGLPTTVLDAAPPAPDPVSHPNGALRIDHVVARTPRFDATVATLERAGLELRRVRQVAREIRQGFMWVGDTILELVEDGGAEAPAFWGLVVVVDDIDALAARLGDLVGKPRAAVQPGRRIATVAKDAGAGLPLAFMTPHVRSAAA